MTPSILSESRHSAKCFSPLWRGAILHCQRLYFIVFYLMPSLWFWLLKAPNIFKGQKHFFSKRFPNNFFYVKNFKNFDPIKIKWTRTRIRKGWKLGTITRGATTLSITTFSITTISMTLNKLRHSAYWHSIQSMLSVIYAECRLCWASQISLFYRVSLCWMSLCWVSLCWMS